MKVLFFERFPIITLLLLLLAAGCKGPETTVVRQNPITEAADTTATEDTTASEASAAFRQINIGEINSIPTLDPLFASNASTMRAVQMVYEGLVRYNENGSLIPGIAKKWSTSGDSLSYQFTLRDNVYYHDSNAFNSGIGRKVKASDIKYVFERMAKNSVPQHAAQLFMPIKGFEPYFREQHNIFNPSQRVLNGVSGIQAPNDSTVVFNLEKRDPHFMQKLASPYAVIYPREAVSDNNPNLFKAVGTGPFQLSRQTGDSVYTFAKYNNYYDSKLPLVNRVDVIVKERESALFKSFAAGDIHLLPELGPETMQGTLNENGELQTAYSDTYTLSKQDGNTRYMLNYNPDSDMSEETIQPVAGLFDSTDTFGNLPGGFISFQSYAEVGTEESNAYNISSGDTLSITNTKDSFSRQFMVKLRNKLQQQGATLQIFDIYTPTRNTALFTAHQLPFYEEDSLKSTTQTLVSFSVPHYSLYHNDIENLYFNRYPWWIDLRSADFTSIQ